ncbi:MAG TPA: glycosyltransferase family 39 protein, partial [Pyrinomonadaceae bacterium]
MLIVTAQVDFRERAVPLVSVLGQQTQTNSLLYEGRVSCILAEAPLFSLRQEPIAMTTAMRPRWTTIVVIGLIAASVFLIGLGSSRLDSWDEAIYAQSAKEMANNGDWITPHWNGKEFFQKPPLLIWLTAFLFKIFGVSETSARAVSAFSGIGVVLLTLLLARRFFDELPAVVAAVALLVSAPMFQFARSGTMDVLLTFFILLAVYAYVKTTDNARWWLVVGLGCGLAVMTKGAAALPLLAALVFA